MCMYISLYIFVIIKLITVHHARFLDRNLVQVGLVYVMVSQTLLLRRLHALKYDLTAR